MKSKKLKRKMNITGRRPSKKKAHNTDPPPLIECDGRSLKVLGYTQSQTASFLQILCHLSK
ncbi:chromatin remodeling factor CHD3 (pickle), putative [Medicago truncatula]|uniref:Chromatin remodeling factor CHD3 (Pickle), putative n=1 Tax=Medicago truncatula TaxID=3880 RepID=G7K1B2_MEDTR|nr:chromatin remodeling factor CHD3 (pickle), putative [Medicago truncatula]